jgi:hypothetical protein
VLVIAVACDVYMVDVDQTEKAALPEIYVEGDNMPEYDTDVGDGDVEITVPTVDIESSEEDDVASN